MSASEEKENTLKRTLSAQTRFNLYMQEQPVAPQGCFDNNPRLASRIGLYMPENQYAAGGAAPQRQSASVSSECSTISVMESNRNGNGTPLSAGANVFFPSPNGFIPYHSLNTRFAAMPFAQMPSPQPPVGTGRDRFSPNVFARPWMPGSGSVSTSSSMQSSGSPTAGVDIPQRPRANVKSVQIKCKFGSLGPGKSQFSSPHGFFLGASEEVVVADTNNHRIQIFDKDGEFLWDFGIPGKDDGQLWYPRKVVVIRRTGRFIVCDRGNEKSRMQVFDNRGQYLKKIAIRYVDIVAGMTLTDDDCIVVVDSVSPTCFTIKEDGELLKWFDCSEYMKEPSDVCVWRGEYFICDFKAHCVVCFSDAGRYLRKIGCESVTTFPNGIDISDVGDVLIGDSHGNRFHISVFSYEGVLLGEYECPYVKVSRCCGLKITTEGYIVTLAKNNHHVLMLQNLVIH